MRRGLTLAVVGVLLGGSASAAAAQGGAADEAAIKAVATNYMAAWAKADAAAISNIFTTDGLDIGADGAMSVGRAAILKASTEALAGPFKGSTLVITTGPVSFLKPDVALAHGTYKVSAGGKVVAEGHWMGVDVKTAGGWQIRALEALIPPPPPPPAAAAPAKKKP
jgi:uncharacterized protein (TIGR02246 family)